MKYKDFKFSEGEKDKSSKHQYLNSTSRNAFGGGGGGGVDPLLSWFSFSSVWLYFPFWLHAFERS